MATMSIMGNKALPAKVVSSARTATPVPVPIVAGTRWLASGAAARSAAGRPLRNALAAATTPSVPGQYLEGAGGDPELAAFQRLQQSVPRPTAAEEARTVLDQGK
ncbi:hypothetical protein GPECTOR_65g159 [Gonium pectorale]|uniref:Uncharacterized protein n=1 Tax=Gonium pectorale TaxID=33097 RepID=A0A150G3Z3_GONPE|nr:hypothetical protein GPECTOR_65g159 [Gonium pectorale]|eukprot:KXZ44541.1 hypothetical protein GPECTOR_65g159 [Gonium pectorale]